jgi:hypothetical protein
MAGSAVKNVDHVGESFTHMPLKKMLVTHMPQKSFQARVCHDLNFRLPVCHSVQLQSGFNGFIALTCGTHI